MRELLGYLTVMQLFDTTQMGNYPFKNNDLQLFLLACRDGRDAVFDTVVVIFASIFFFQRLGTLNHGVANVDFWDISCGHGGLQWFVMNLSKVPDFRFCLAGGVILHPNIA